MTKPPILSRASRFAVLMAVLALLLGAVPVLAASSIRLDARALVGGRYQVGGWLGIAVTLVNDGEPTDGELTATTDAGTVRRHVDMPAGAHKVVSMYVEPDAFQRKVTLEYREPNGTAKVEVDVRVLDQPSQQVAVIGDGSGSLRSQLLGGPETGAPEPLVLSSADIPERPEPLDGLASIVWAADSNALTEAQRRSLERWMSDGGNLVVIGGADWQARTAAFADLLPVEGLSAIDGVSQDAFADWTGAATLPSATATVSAGTLRDGARSLISAADGTVLASMSGVGAGRVIFIATDMAADAYRAWEGSTAFWDRLLPDSTVFDQFFGGMAFPEEMQNAMGNALGTLPSLEVPPAELLLFVIVGYILLIGPISYVVLKRADRREMAWITAPVLVVVFTASSFGIGRTMKGGDVILNQVTLVRAAQDADVATVETYGGLYSPDRSDYDLTVDADALIGRLTAPNFSGIPTDGRSGGSGAIIEQGQPAHLRDLAIGVSGFEAVHASSILNHRPSLSVTWQFDDDRIAGTVTNNGDEPIVDVAYISTAGGKRVGDIDPGESVEFTLPSSNPNGSSASDQVYGFGGFDTATEEQRTRALRRQVIDALVGYGGFPMPLATVAGRGPYLIGWRDGAGPMPLGIDAVTAQRYETVVEVLSVRPVPASGEVVINPAQMGVSIVATEGDSSAGGPGTILLGQGSAVAAVTLPLEAVDLQPAEVAIILAPDPSYVMDPGMLGGGFWPAGIMAEVLNPQTGEWTALGDISERSRYEIDDPATVLSSAGRIEVRISTDEEINPNFGQPTVFVSAQVSGVIGE